MDDEEETIKEIQPTPGQQECVDKIIKILLLHYFAINTSNMGTGKSIMCIMVIRYLKPKYKVLICPSALVNPWNRYNDSYSVGFDLIISYDVLRGSANEKNKSGWERLKHGLLKRHGDQFKITKKFLRMIDEGVIICYDECQKLKSDRIQRKAAMELNRELMSAMHSGDSSKFCAVYMFSATPFYTERHCVNICYTAGILTKDLFPESGIKNSGLLQFKQYCETKINNEKTNSIWGSLEIRNKKAEKIAYTIAYKVFLPAVSCFCPTTINEYSKQTIFYTHEKMPKIGLKILEASEEMIHKRKGQSIKISSKMEAKYKEIIESDSESKILSTRSGITHGQITAQTIKTYYIIIPMAERILTEVTSSKVIIFLEYKEAIKVAKRALSDYGVITLTGSSSSRTGERDQLISKFQRPDLKYRVLICIFQVGSVGLEFDDKIGPTKKYPNGFPRFVLKPRIHSTENAIQASGRTSRTDSKTNSVVIVCGVYNGDDSEIEVSLQKTTSEKSKILKETLKNNGIIPPINFSRIENILEKENIFPKLLEEAGSHDYRIEEVEEEPTNITIRKSNISFDF